MDNRHIMFVEDDSRLQDIVVRLLLSKGFQVSAYSDGEAALNNFKADKFAVVVSDLKMPKLDGLTLLGEIREIDKDVPFILLTAFMDVLDVKSAFEFGVTEVLTKPIKVSDLAKKLDEILAKKDSKEDAVAQAAAGASALYKKVPVEMVLEGHFIEYDRYLMLKPGKYIVVVQAGDDVDKGRIEHYRAKGVSDLYVLESNLKRKLLADQAEIKQILKRENKISFDLKAKVIADSSFIEYETIKTDGPGKFILDHLYEVFSSISDLEMLPSDLKILCKTLYDKHDHLFSHAVAVGTLSMSMAGRLDISVKENLINIGLGGFLHDIGKIKLPVDITKVNPDSLGASELAELKTHTETGRDLLESIPGIPEIIISIVNQHHEYIDGSGYPNRLRTMKITQGAKIVALANDYVNITLEDSPYKHYTPSKALEFLWKEFRSKYDGDVFRALGGILKVS